MFSEIVMVLCIIILKNTENVTKLKSVLEMIMNKVKLSCWKASPVPF